MINKEINISSLEEVFNRVINAVENSKEQIYQITEEAGTEKENILIKLKNISQEIDQVIKDVDESEKKYDESRRQLVKVSKNFQKFSEKDIQQAYETAYKNQIDLFILRERELNLKTRRNELQLRLKNLELTMEKAKNLITQVNIVFDYLTNDINKMSDIVESVKIRQMFGLKVIQAQEEERKRVARDIHDGPAQSMANIVIRTEIAERLMNNHNIELAIQELKDLKTMIRKSLTDVRQIIFDLRPMALDDLGLLPTVKKFIPELAKREDLKIKLNISGRERRLAPGMEVAIFRLIQEILNNVVKHAKATFVQANIEYGDEFILVNVRDNGIGFKQEEVIKNKNFLGLMGMKERLEMLEGTFDIDSVKNTGTTITFKIPINESGEKL